MQAVFKQNGDDITITATSAIAAGAIVKVGELYGVAKFDITSGGQGVISTKGVFEFEKAATSDVYAQGGAIWYNTSDGKIYPTSAASCAQIGVATVAAVSGGTIVEGKLK